MIRIGPGLTIDDAHLEERFVRASGPGGQHVNKVATAVELRFDVAGSTPPDDVKARLAVIAGRRMTDDGVLVVDSRAHRTQGRNRDAARDRLIALIQRAAARPRSRTATKPPRAARERRITEKKRRSVVKGARARATRDDG
jgi:ribosome-associated protein